MSKRKTDDMTFDAAAMVNMEYLANENTRLRGALEEIRRRMVDTPDDLRNEDGETDYWEYSQDGILEFIDTTLQSK